LARVAFENVGKVYEDGTRALAELNLEIQDGEFMVIVGPSGCGKTTAMRLVAGLETVTEGNVWIGDRVVNSLTPKARDIAMVFQNYALYPQMSVFGNIAFPLQMEKRPRDQVKARVTAVARSLGLTELLDRKPGQLSGGQRQRVAMGRAIARNPEVFLMDEPLSNLDAKLRAQMRGEVLRLQREVGVTAIYVTHDQVEAMTMGDRVVVMKDGVLQQVDSGQTLYDRPGTLFVARFIGNPTMNVMRGRIGDGSDGNLTCRIGSSEFVIPPAAVERHPKLRSYPGADVAVGIRPEATREASGGLAGSLAHQLSMGGEIRLIESLGAEFLVHVASEFEGVPEEDALTTDSSGNPTAGSYENVLVARIETAPRASRGERVELVIDLDKLHFFDLESGEAVRED
jgi:multiple sugar transport system ATP-binding protein